MLALAADRGSEPDVDAVDLPRGSRSILDPHQTDQITRIASWLASYCLGAPHEIARIELTETLVAELRARHPEALGELLRQHGAEIQAVAFLIVRNERDAEEILADTVLTAWRKIDTLRDPGALRSWLLTTATRLALRRRRPFRPHLMSLDAARDVAASDPSPIDRLVLREAINRLPPRMRAVVALHHVADLPTAQVAAAMGRSENTVKTQLREARARLRAALADGPTASAPVGREVPS